MSIVMFTASLVRVQTPGRAAHSLVKPERQVLGMCNNMQFIEGKLRMRLLRNDTTWVPGRA
jgi:hypothetical protein